MESIVLTIKPATVGDDGIGTLLMIRNGLINEINHGLQGEGLNVLAVMTITNPR